MVDYASVGFSLAVTSLALIGGFLGAGTFFFLNHALRKDLDNGWRYFSLAVSAGFFIIFLSLVYFFSASGSVYTQYSKTLPENNQILVNLSCVNKMNCSATLQNQIQISCQEKTCPPQIICPNVTPLPIEIQYSKSFKCPPIFINTKNVELT